MSLSTRELKFEAQSTIEVPQSLAGVEDCSEANPMEKIYSSRDEIENSSGINLSDYSNATWTGLVSYGVPTVGVAVLALTHPVMFLAGVAISILGLGSAYAADIDTTNYSFCGLSPKSKDNDLPHELTIATVISTSSDDEADMNEITFQTSHTRENATVDNFPALENIIVDKAHFSSLHAEDFFKIFFGDDAPFSFKDFQEKRGDLNVSYSRWENSKIRIVHFRTPTRAAFFGASHATAVKSQELKVSTKTCVVMDSTTFLKDIPFGDRFVVEERWKFCSDHEKNLIVTISAQVNFHNFCPFESQIKTKTISTMRQTIPEWRVLAETALLATHRRVKAKECKVDDGIEVGIAEGSNITYVVGEEDWEMDPLPSERHSQPSSLKKLRTSIVHTFTGRKNCTRSCDSI